MASIQWSSFICDREGIVDVKRCRAMVSLGLAVAGAIPLVLAMLGINIGGGDTGHMALGAGVLVSPLTAGRIAEGLASRRPAEIEP